MCGAAPRPVRAEPGLGRRAGSDAAARNPPGQLRDRALPFGSGLGASPGLGPGRSRRRGAPLSALYRRLDGSRGGGRAGGGPPFFPLRVSAGSASRRRTAGGTAVCPPVAARCRPRRPPLPGAGRRTPRCCPGSAHRSAAVVPALCPGWARPRGNPTAPRDYRWRCPGGLRDFSKRG